MKFMKWEIIVKIVFTQFVGFKLFCLFAAEKLHYGSRIDQDAALVVASVCGMVGYWWSEGGKVKW